MAGHHDHLASQGTPQRRGTGMQNLRTPGALRCRDNQLLLMLSAPLPPPAAPLFYSSMLERARMHAVGRAPLCARA
jgi:hypothetical protein